MGEFVLPLQWSSVLHKMYTVHKMHTVPCGGSRNTTTLTTITSNTALIVQFFKKYSLT